MTTQHDAPIIGITTNGRNEDDAYYLAAAYVEAVRAAGGVPILLPPGEPNPETVLALLDGVIFSGGGDIDPAEYGAAWHPSLSHMDAERDRFELALARLAVAEAAPTLGICRGAQVLTVAAGGALIVDVPDAVEEAILHRAAPEWTSHAVTLEADSALAQLLGEAELPVPSWHHQAPRDVPPGWRLAARAPDGVIEALEHPEHPYLIAVQWHPERAPDDERQQRLFQALVEAARARRAARG